MAEKERTTRRGGLAGELLLALPPTVMVLGVVYLFESFRHQRVLFTSLAASAFLIYRDPAHPMNGVRVTVTAHVVAVALGLGAALLLGPGYLAGAVAMTATIVTLIVFDIVHPPAIGTALGFGFFPEQTSSAGFFIIALVMLAALIVLQRAATWLLRRMQRSVRD